MSRAATERFIELTHEAYRQHCGDRIGDSIEGISPMSLTAAMGWTITGSKTAYGAAPWPGRTTSLSSSAFAMATH